MTDILFITYYWPPCGGPGVQRPLKFVKYLPGWGVKPTVITVDDRKASYPLLDPSLLQEIPHETRIIRTKTFEPFNFYKRLSGSREIPHSGFVNEGKANFLHKTSRFVRGNLFVPDPRIGWNRYAYQAARKIVAEGKTRIVLTSSPPHSTQLVGLRLKEKFNLAWIADLRDPWTDIFYYKQLYHLGITARKDARLELKVLQHADVVVVVSEDMKRLFVQKARFMDPAKIHVIPNGYDEEDFTLPSHPPRDCFILTYTGSVSGLYDLSGFLKAFAVLAKKHPDIPVKLRFVGNVSADVAELIDQEGIGDQVELIPYLPHSESVRYLMQTTALLLAIPKVKDNRGILTGKIFEYLASRKPIVCIGPPDGDAAAIVRNCRAGEVFRYDADKEILEGLEAMLKRWQADPDLDLGGDAFRQYSRRSQAQHLGEIIHSLELINIT